MTRKNRLFSMAAAQNQNNDRDNSGQWRVIDLDGENAEAHVYIPATPAHPYLLPARIDFASAHSGLSGSSESHDADHDTMSPEDRAIMARHLAKTHILRNEMCAVVFVFEPQKFDFHYSRVADALNRIVAARRGGFLGRFLSGRNPG